MLLLLFFCLRLRVRGGHQRLGPPRMGLPEERGAGGVARVCGEKKLKLSCLYNVHTCLASSLSASEGHACVRRPAILALGLHVAAFIVCPSRGTVDVVVLVVVTIFNVIFLDTKFFGFVDNNVYKIREPCDKCFFQKKAKTLFKF